MFDKYRVITALGRRELLNWLSDRQYLEICYRAKFNRKLNLDSPESFNEKMQWLKLNDRKTLWTDLADKYVAKQIVGEWVGSQHIIPNIGVWHDANEIDFKSLPNQFVLKCNHDSGSVIVIRDKSIINEKEVKKSLNRSLKHTGFWYGREWPYKNIRPLIIAEKYMEDETENEGLTDYKFFCFNGKPKMLYVSVGLEDHSTARISFYDLDGKSMPFRRKDYDAIQGDLLLPHNYSDMLRIATQIAEKINNPFVRVDLYSIRKQVYFSEITFYPCNGVMPIEPIAWDRILGSWINLGNETL